MNADAEHNKKYSADAAAVETRYIDPGAACWAGDITPETSNLPNGGGRDNVEALTPATGISTPPDGFRGKGVKKFNRRDTS
ncbi:hypothetical protein [Actinomyces vulturis]|uniref:hypothetical protein n=1 Tax=Actinomyces vulturis TaxID=1857645 RepID=UPI000836EEF3|nr:hypothetical protein [Actinomyces vulturis]